MKHIFNTYLNLEFKPMAPQFGGGRQIIKNGSLTVMLRQSESKTCSR